MEIHLEKVSLEQKSVLANLMELYLHDFSEYDQSDVGPDGLFGFEYLDSYWTDTDRHAFIVYVKDHIAGFVLVNKIVILEENTGANSIAEFFIMRKYRRKGVGTQVATRILDMFPGQWEVSQVADNIPSTKFWKKVLDEYTNGKYEYEIVERDKCKCHILTFGNEK